MLNESDTEKYHMFFLALASKKQGVQRWLPEAGLVRGGKTMIKRHVFAVMGGIF